jgi:4-diphosphocytidyl-2-C-methyl-D-erythritol kinase
VHLLPLVVHHAHAKINLGLYILRERSDGFHDIATVFHRIELHDDLLFTDEDSIRVSSTDSAAPGGEKNICHRAAAALREITRTSRGVHVHITKRIPVGAGLGGGSSDAAGVLLTLPSRWGIPVDRTSLMTIALRLGSDVPFFLQRGSAVAGGRGEVLEYFPLDVPYTIVVCHPEIFIPTAWAYGRIEPRPGPERGELRALVTEGMRDPSLLTSELRNDFEAVVFETYPGVAAVKRLMLSRGAAYASLSGSGAALYGLFADRPAAEEAAIALRQSGCRCFLTPPHYSPA